MAHLMATQSVLDFGSTNSERRPTRFFREFCPPIARDARASSSPSTDRKGFYRYEFNFRTNSQPNHSTSRATLRAADPDSVHREYLEGWRTLECRAVSRPVTRNPIKLGDANEI